MVVVPEIFGGGGKGRGNGILEGKEMKKYMQKFDIFAIFLLKLSNLV